NKIMEKVLLCNVTIRGRSIKLFAATKTNMWVRPASVAQDLDDPFAAAVQDNEDRIPEGTVEICVREGDHASNSDTRDHYTGVCFDANENGTSVRFQKKK
ncbi:hypothetical protein EJ08DRAFT_592573, partial [Tothia fuscella]